MSVRLEANANCRGLLSKVWFHSLRALRRKEVSLREIIGLRMDRPTVIAIGGNSVGQLLQSIALEITFFRSPVITHGNGPQVGKLLAKDPTRSFPECVAQTQVDIGGELKAELLAKIEEVKGKEYAGRVQIEVIPTRVVVAENDPAFNNPTKPVGSFYTWEEVQALGTVTSLSNTRFSVTVSGVDWFIEKRADAKAETPYRRVVPSPKPLAIHPEDMQKIRDAIAAGKLVIACGGGGVPVIKNDDGSYTEVAGVIDKDLASAVLSAELEARELIISTGDLVTPFFRIKENERLIGRAVNYIQLQYALCDLRGGKISKSDLLDAFGERGRLLWKGLRHSNFISGGYLSGTASIHANLGIIDQRGFNAAMKDSWVCPNNAAFSDAELSATYQMVQSALRGQYPAGSMGEKIEAAVNALRRGVNTVMISHPNMAWIKFEGTLITRGFDLTGRIYNAGRIIGNWMEAHGRQRPSWLPDNNIQRWLV